MGRFLLGMSDSIEIPTFTSSTGGADIETRIVSPIPSANKIPNAVADFIVA
jgi:hypothetical protein